MSQPRSLRQRADNRGWSAPRRGAAVALITGTCLVGMLAGAPAAGAHPLGNATVNHYDGLTLYPDHLTDTAVEDIAEIPTLQRKPLIDTNSDGQLTPAELAGYAARQCAALTATDQVTVAGTRLALRVTHADYTERPGAIGLFAGRLDCQLTAPADLSSPTTVTLNDQWDGAGIGWHELTAVGHGVSLHNSPIPAQSISDALQRYPNDLLSSPLDQRSATLTVTPGADASTYAATPSLPSAGTATRLLGSLTTTFNGLVGRTHLTLGVGLLALLLAMVLGAGHAFLPGHGKTIMAAYLVGKRGRYRDVATVGATVTLTHTAGVLLIGLLLSVSATLAPTAVEQDLAVVSGLIVAGVGAWLLLTALRRRTNTPLVGSELSTLKTTGTATAPPPAPRPRTEPAMAATVARAGTAAAALPHPATLPTGTVAAPDHHPSHEHSDPDPHHHGPHDHGPHDHGHHDHGHHDHGHHDHGHRHGLFGRQHHHSHPPAHGSPDHQPIDAATARFSRRGLIGLGVAGGLVPSPSALLVLLAAVALGRTVFGIVLVLGYGLGMAAALTVAGLLLVRLRGRIARIAGSSRLAPINWLLTALPVLTAGLVLIVGVGLVLRALAGSV